MITWSKMTNTMYAVECKVVVSPHSFARFNKKKLSAELGKVLPKYRIEHDPSWFVDWLALF